MKKDQKIVESWAGFEEVKKRAEKKKQTNKKKVKK